MLRGLFEGNLDATERHMRIVWLCAVTSVTAEDYTLKSLVFHAGSVIGPHICDYFKSINMAESLFRYLKFSVGHVFQLSKPNSYSRTTLEITAKII